MSVIDGQHWQHCFIVLSLRRQIESHSSSKRKKEEGKRKATTQQLRRHTIHSFWCCLLLIERQFVILSFNSHLSSQVVVLTHHPHMFFFLCCICHVSWCGVLISLFHDILSRHENTWERKKRKRESRRTLQLHMIIISLKSQVREINAVNNKLVCPWSTSHTLCAHHEPVTVVLSYQSESLLFCRERLPTKKTNTLIVLTVFVFLCLLISWQPSLPYPLHTSKW